MIAYVETTNFDMQMQNGFGITVKDLESRAEMRVFCVNNSCPK